ncbi:hypothetical protein BKA69DRAFT_1097602 [Paraphysoderma sedebokerense]|nr:hypothetical protein BKA69DRAFT_1097602 [Paraphysoderma sedebokerense]
MSIRKRIVSFALVYTAAVIFSLLTLLSADTHSPWFLTNHAVDVAPQSSLDIISSTINSTHILVLDSDCQIRQFTYNASSITSLGVIVGFPRTQIDGGLCDTEWAPWRATSSALIKWNPFKNRLMLWKYVHDYGPAGHRAQIFEFDGPTQTDRLTFDYVSDNITFFQKAFAYPSTSFYIDPTTGFFYGCVFNNGTLDPEGDGGFFIARINNLISTATHIFNMTLPVSSIQFNCSKIVSVLCVFTTTRTVIEYRISDLSFHGMYSLDSNALSLYLDPASIQVPGQNSILYFHRKANQSNQMVLQNMNFTGFTLQTFTIPYTLSFPYDTPVYDIAMSPSGTIYTAFSTMLNSSLSRGGTDIVVTKHSPSLQRISSLVGSDNRNCPANIRSAVFVFRHLSGFHSFAKFCNGE